MDELFQRKITKLQEVEMAIWFARRNFKATKVQIDRRLAQMGVSEYSKSGISDLKKRCEKMVTELDAPVKWHSSEMDAKGIPKDNRQRLHDMFMNPREDISPDRKPIPTTYRLLNHVDYLLTYRSKDINHDIDLMIIANQYARREMIANFHDEPMDRADIDMWINSRAWSSLDNYKAYMENLKTNYLQPMSWGDVGKAPTDDELEEMIKNLNEGKNVFAQVNFSLRLSPRWIRFALPSQVLRFHEGATLRDGKLIIMPSIQKRLEYQEELELTPDEEDMFLVNVLGAEPIHTPKDEWTVVKGFKGFIPVINHGVFDPNAPDKVEEE